MKNKLWTATVRAACCVLTAQCKDSKTSLMRRLIADDPVWHGGVKVTYEKRHARANFNRGLSITASRLQR